MIDVNKITSTLAKLPDAQLQQYAQMHKSDPYIMALAMTESNRRKELRSAGQGAQGMQEMPKVVDQAVAEMAPQQLPEDMGIGQLPAGDMNFADGGIVAFADGGDAERYNGTQGSLTGEARSPFAFLNPADILGGLYGGARRIFSEGIDAEAAAKRRAAEELLAQENISGMDRRFMAPRGVATLPMAANAQPAVLPTASDAAPTAATGKKAPSAAPAGGKPASTALGFREQYLKDLEGMGPGKAQTLEELLAERTALMPKDKAFAGLEAALSKEAEGVEGEKKDALWMAVTQAGLAAAAGGSPYALKNIAEGFGTGLAGYKESLKEFKKADKERQKAMADIEQARRAEARGDVDAALSLREKSQDRMDKFNDRKAAGLAAITGSEISAAASKYSTDVGAATARATANRTPAEIQVVERIMAEKKIPFSEALAFLSSTKREPQSLEKYKSDWAKDAYLQTKYPNVNDYITMMTGSAGGASQLSPADAALVNKYSR